MILLLRGVGVCGFVWVLVGGFGVCWFGGGFGFCDLGFWFVGLVVGFGV